ncbi:hypothetical protein [Rubrobacter indicoceani]|uniref:hypothetical protein n=1 Tax=Rubrobacter indicoceani TaxID=2051957 RepID=UPI000E5A79F5|nr:hypothetical protein [Rubrobacter indicoceani]
MAKGKKDYEEKYTEPELRERLKEKIKKGGKGGKPGQWSARKSQMLSQEYEKQGGGYRGEKDDDQKNLEKWTDEEWQTKEGSADARKGDSENSETERYLPKEAWENLSEREKKETDQKKRQASKQGEQYVGNAPAAKRKGREARKDDPLPLNGYESLTVREVEKKMQGLSRDDIETLRNYEAGHKNRKTLISKFDARL